MSVLKILFTLFILTSNTLAHASDALSSHRVPASCASSSPTSLTTKYPVVLVHGLFGWGKKYNEDHIIDYWNKIPFKLCELGVDVYIVAVSAMESAEVRGEQLLEQIDIIRIISASEKVNIIAHSQGAQSSRYVASVAPEWVASVTTAAGTNAGGIPLVNTILSSIASHEDVVDEIYQLMNAVGHLISILSGQIGLSQNLSANLYDLSSEGMAKFNEKYPQGLPDEHCGSGPAQEDGVYYFSWSGNQAFTNFLDPTDYFLKSLSLVTSVETDGLVPRCSSHLGTVIRDDYPMNHFDQVNHLFGINAAKLSPTAIITNHVRRLQELNL